MEIVGNSEFKTISHECDHLHVDFGFVLVVQVTVGEDQLNIFHDFSIGCVGARVQFRFDFR